MDWGRRFQHRLLTMAITAVMECRPIFPTTTPGFEPAWEAVREWTDLTLPARDLEQLAEKIQTAGKQRLRQQQVRD
jgi:hypothetical protein